MDTFEVNDRIAQAMDEVAKLLDSIPETMENTTPRYRLQMAEVHLENARDAVSAAKDRMAEVESKKNRA
jgi:ElaB/YqjD/DUF883 family membrane-anchored ribosome-binding protein